MSGKTKIEWADRVWNPTVGCTPVSEGCRHCYAKRIFERFYQSHRFEDVVCYPERLNIPEGWIKPQRIFVDSMSDLFHESVPFEFIAEVMWVMIKNPQHTFIILTKRPKVMSDFFGNWICLGKSKPIPNNVWLGVSVEDQWTADERIPLLLQTPAAKRFVSVEPMLGSVDLRRGIYSMPPDGKLKGTSTDGLDWVICGGESGPGARPMHPDWVRFLRDQCVAAGVPFFFKQWGEWTTNPGNTDMRNRKQTYFGNLIFSRVGKKYAGRLLDGVEWNQRPEGKDEIATVASLPRDDMTEEEK